MVLLVKVYKEVGNTIHAYNLIYSYNYNMKGCVSMKIEIYDPPMCCPTGICGPSVDETLVKTKENLELLKKKYPEAIVERYMISQQPSKFKENEAVFQLIKEKGRDVLPITTVNGIIIKSSQYPTLEEIESHL